MRVALDPGAIHTDWFARTDYEAFSRLFEQSFGHPVDRPLWLWKYLRAQPLGAASWRGDQLLAFYGGMPFHARWLGRPVELVEIGDVMVEASARGILKRRGVFWQTAAYYLTRMVGPGLRFHSGFGFPNERAMILGEKLGLYARAGEMVQLTWLPRTPGWRPFSRTVPIRTSELERIAPAWTKMARDLEDAVLLTRDAAYVGHRFLSHPHAPYRLQAVRSRLTGSWHGVLIMRDRGEDGLELLDVIAPVERIPDLIEIAREEAHALGRARLFSWLSRDFADRFIADPQRHAPLQMYIALSADCPDLAAVRGKLWMTAGDTDFR